MSDHHKGYSMDQLPKADRPRERLLQHGAEAMTSVELIAILLGSGVKGIPVLQLAQDIILQFGGLHKLAEATVPELCQVRGLGPAKALQLKAALGIGLRLSKTEDRSKCRIASPIQAYNLIKDELENKHSERLIAILLDTKGYLLSQEVISMGGLSQAQAHPREIFHSAIRHHAASVILAHNHPSGDITPSTQDYETTAKLIEAGHLIGIPLHDHIIVGSKRYLSMRQENPSLFNP